MVTRDFSGFFRIREITAFEQLGTDLDEVSALKFDGVCTSAYLAAYSEAVEFNHYSIQPTKPKRTLQGIWVRCWLEATEELIIVHAIEISKNRRSWINPLDWIENGCRF